MEIPSHIALDPALLEALRDPFAAPHEAGGGVESAEAAPEGTSTHDSQEPPGAPMDAAQALLGLGAWNDVAGAKTLIAPAPEIDAADPAALAEGLADYVLRALG